MLQVRQVNVAIRCFEHAVGRGRLRDGLDLRFEIAFGKFLIGQIARFDSVKCVTSQCVIIQVAVFRIECDAVGRDSRRTFLLLIPPPAAQLKRL